MTKHYTVMVTLEEVTDPVQPSTAPRGGLADPGSPRKVRDLIRVTLSGDSPGEVLGRIISLLNDQREHYPSPLLLTPRTGPMT